LPDRLFGEPASKRSTSKNLEAPRRVGATAGFVACDHVPPEFQKEFHECLRMLVPCKLTRSTSSL
jgi:hypothetical protein